ncbi:unnamed protein product [Boreogadus saida]
MINPWSCVIDKVLLTRSEHRDPRPRRPLDVGGAVNKLIGGTESLPLVLRSLRIPDSSLEEHINTLPLGETSSQTQRVFSLLTIHISG